MIEQVRYDLLIKEVDTRKTAPEIFESFADADFSVFLDSSLYIDDTGRYSIIAFDPFITFSSKGSNIDLCYRSDSGNRTEHLRGDAVALLKRLYDSYKVEYDGELPFVGGCAGYLSYDLNDVSGNHLEDTCAAAIGDGLKNRAVDDLQIPDIVFGFYDSVVIIDNLCKRTYIAVIGDTQANGETANGTSANMTIANMTTAGGPMHTVQMERRADEIAGIVMDTATVVPAATEATTAIAAYGTLNPNGAHLKSDMTWETYRAMIDRAREYIRNGDIYQVNLSQRFETDLREAPFDIYKRLRKASPVPFAAYLNLGGFQILSSSMERFMKIRDGIAETRPIKGTRPRGTTPEEDELNAEELVASAKDRAEHVMIVDLERNDLGRFCEIGSVEVKKLLDLEKHSNVYHLVSTVTGRIRPGVDMIDCILSAFPGGSITGAPKLRSMEIIDELEPVKRGVYTGSIGYIGFNSVCDLNIVIRTIVIKGGKAYYHVGGGIVWDSTAAGEYAETLDKGSGMMRTLIGR